MEREPIVRRIPANTVPFGEDISRNGRTLWGAFDGDTLVTWAATAPEARRKYKKMWWGQLTRRRQGEGWAL